ncbi:MAG TPA: hypothetical protein VJH97_04000 [Candidatus Nanoarchaeia archaeon]|nr:hypothetical protein [Candidatus Nanoarchaeia archaeon]
MEESEKKISDKVLIFTILLIVLLLVVVFSIQFFVKQETPLTIDDLHALNLQGKLSQDQGYVQNGYSFVNVDGFWYTEFNSQSAKNIYSLNFRYGPREVADVPFEGRLNATLFNDAPSYHVTFNPTGFDGDFTYVTLAVSDLNENMIKVFQKIPIAACDRNETYACSNRPIVTCNSSSVVFYMMEALEPSVVIDDNCIMLKGTGLDLVKSVDKLLFTFYNIQ